MVVRILEASAKTLSYLAVTKKTAALFHLSHSILQNKKDLIGFATDYVVSIAN